MANFEKDIKEIFDRYECHYEWSVIGNNVEIEVIWGDWKHDHGLIDYAMKQKGYYKVGETLTEENGSDSYSSIHKYIKL